MTMHNITIDSSCYNRGKVELAVDKQWNVWAGVPCATFSIVGVIMDKYSDVSIYYLCNINNGQCAVCHFCTHLLSH